MRLGLNDRVPMNELEYTKLQLDNSKILLFGARSVKEAVFLEMRMKYLKQKLKELKKVKGKKRVAA